MNRLKRIAALLTLALLAALCAGCAQKTAAPAGTQTPESAQTPAVQTPADTQPAAPSADDTETDPPQITDPDAIHVRSVRELLEAIAPDAKIVVEPGRYNLTEFLRDYPNARDQVEWDEAHRYVTLNAVFDGVEVIVRDVHHLSITGGAFDPAQTEIVTEPRYAAVLNFENCTDVELACLTMGHTEAGDCTGNVLDFDDNCADVFLRTVDLYGCGVYGICARNCANLTVSNSTIRDCEYGSVDIEDCTGDFLFTACTLSGSYGGGNYVPSGTSKLAFVGCYFGEGESTGFYFRDDIAFENCEWSDPTSYPDRGEELDVTYGFYPESMKQFPFDYGCLGRSDWIGYIEVNPESGETEYFGLMGQDAKPSLLVTLDLNEDGTGTLAFGTERENVQWEFMDDGLACRRGDGSNVYFSFYQMKDPESGEYRSWMMMRNGGNNIVWLY